jgi:CHAT domain-containing protein
MAHAEEHKIREYLLGQLTEAEEEQVELRLLTEPDFAAEYDIVVNEVTDDYIAGKFEAEELKQVESHFFKSGERQNKLKFAQALKQRKSEMDADTGKKSWFGPLLAIAASVALLAGGGFYIWRVLSANSDLNRGLAALQSAFRDERPLEARISKFDYAPYLTTRGKGPEKINQDELRRAELTLLDAVKKNPTPAVHHGLGKVYLAKKDFDAAITEFDEAIKGDPKNAQIYSDLGATWLEKGRIDLEKGKAESASPASGRGMEELGRSLGNINKALDIDPNNLEAIFNRALCHQSMTLSQKAADDWREYLKRDSKSPWAEEARRNLKALENSYRSAASPEQILNDFHQAQQQQNDKKAWEIMSQSREMITGKMVAFQLTRGFLEESGNPKNPSVSLALLDYAGHIERENSGDSYVSDLARYYHGTSDSTRERLRHAQREMTNGFDLCLASKYTQALERFRGARDLFANADDSLEAEMVNYWIAYCENQNDHFAEGIRTLNALTDYSRRQKYKWLQAQALYLLANCYGLLRETSKAIDYNQKALLLARALSDTYTEQKLLTEMATYYTYMARAQHGLAFLHQSLELGTQSPNTPRQAWRNFTFASETFYSMRLYDAAAAYEQAALQLVQEHRWSASLAHLSKIHLGMIYAGMQRYDQATSQLQESLDLANSISDDPSSQRMIGYSLLQLGNLERVEGDCGRALKFYDRALAVYDQLKFDLDRYDAHRGRLACYLAEKDDNAMQNELDYVLNLFEEYRSEILEEQNRNSFFDAQQSVYDLAVDYAFTKGEQLKAFHYSEVARARSLLDGLRNKASLSHTSGETDLAFPSASQPLSLSQIQNGLPNNLEVVQYNVLKDRLLIWTISKDESKVFEQPISSEQLAAQIANYVNAISGRSANSELIVRQEATALYELLITPIESRLDSANELCLIPDKALFYLPFASLISPRTGDYLVARQPLLYSPSATVLVMCSRIAEARVGSETLLAVGNPTFSSGDYPELPVLPAAEREAREIATEYANASTLIGPEAIKNSILPRLQLVSIMHFACHYLADESTPLNSKLLLARSKAGISDASDSVLSSADILRHRLPKARLVVLSACQTGGDRYFNGEGMVGIARTFLLAGTPLVIASQWSVESTATSDLMIKFHHYRKAGGLPSPSALRQAQLDLINGPEARYREPYYWAAFFPVGGYTTY